MNKQTINMTIRSIVVATLFALSMESVSAADWIGDFYSSAGAGVNVTTPAAIASQNSLGFSGGGISWRVPNKNFQPFSITPPSLKAGCNGIDFYAGAFSFPNLPDFVQTLRNFGQQATGYFFSLALKSMAPEISATLDVINDLANRANQFSINGCKAAENMFGSQVAGLLERDAQTVSSNVAAIGGAADKFADFLNIKTDYASTLKEKYKQDYNGKEKSQITKADVENSESVPTQQNVLYLAMVKAKFTNFTEDERELIMTIVGPTLIIRDKPSQDSTLSLVNEGLPDNVAIEKLVGDVAGQTSMTYYTCGDPECLNVVQTTTTTKSFAYRANQAVNAIRAAIQNRTPLHLSPDDELVVRLSSVPLVRAASLAETSGIGGMVASAMLPDLIDYAAWDAAGHMMGYYLDLAERAVIAHKVNVPKGYESAVDQMLANIRHKRKIAMAKVGEQYIKLGNPMSKLDQLEKIERLVYSNLNDKLSANAHFGKSR